MQPEGMGLESCEPINYWVVIMQAPESGPCGKMYEGQVFRLSIKFPGKPIVVISPLASPP
jgi:ubiquitin-protein ligase